MGFQSNSATKFKRLDGMISGLPLKHFNGTGHISGKPPDHAHRQRHPGGTKSWFLMILFLFSGF
jgi:hypothetical protein